MSEINIDSYTNFNTAISTTNSLIISLSNAKNDIDNYHKDLKDNEIFMGPIKDNCVQEVSIISNKLNNDKKTLVH